MTSEVRSGCESWIQTQARLCERLFWFYFMSWAFSTGRSCHCSRGPGVSAETGAGGRSDYLSVWLRLLSLSSGHLWRLPTEQWGR